MTKVTWLGDGTADENKWGGLTFKKGEAVDVTDEQMLKTARKNPYFKVAGEKAKPEAPAAANPMGRPDDIPENAAFASQEQLDARHEASQQLADEQDDEAKRGPGRPRKS